MFGAWTPKSCSTRSTNSSGSTRSTSVAGCSPPAWTATATKLARIGLPEDLTGRSVLDIGAWDGAFSFEAERRGAKRVLVTDSFIWQGKGVGSKAGFELARAALGSKVEDMLVDVMDLDPADVALRCRALPRGPLSPARSVGGACQGRKRDRSWGTHDPRDARRHASHRSSGDRPVPGQRAQRRWEQLVRPKPCRGVRALRDGRLHLSDRVRAHARAGDLRSGGCDKRSARGPRSEVTGVTPPRRSARCGFDDGEPSSASASPGQVVMDAPVVGAIGNSR